MKIGRVARSSTVVIAVAVQKLVDNATTSWSVEEKLFLDALRRSKNSLNDATVDQLSEYVKSLEFQQLRGVMSNVKGQYHELLFAHAENIDGDEVRAELFKETNHPGADVKFIVDGDTIGQVQLKATDNAAAISEHRERYPDIEIRSTSELSDRFSGVNSSGFSNSQLEEDMTILTGKLEGDGIVTEIEDGIATSALVSAAITAGKILRTGDVSESEVKRVLGDVTIGAVAAIVLEALIG